MFIRPSHEDLRNWLITHLIAGAADEKVVTDLGVDDDEEVLIDENGNVVEATEDPDETTADGEDENLGLTPEQIKEAKNLYKMLANKETQKDVVRLMAQQAGLLNAETPKEVKAAKKDLKVLVKEKLGPEYGFLSDKLGDVLEAVLAEERSVLNATVENLSLKDTEQATVSALDRLARETKGESRKVEGRMIELMDRILPSPNLSVYDYMSDLYKLASSGKSTARAAAEIADKIKRNAGNAADRLQGKGPGGSAGKQVGQGPEKKGIRASVEYAMKQMGLNK